MRVSTYTYRSMTHQMKLQRCKHNFHLLLNVYIPSLLVGPPPTLPRLYTSLQALAINFVLADQIILLTGAGKFKILEALVADEYPHPILLNANVASK